MQDTIVAISSAVGPSARMIVRLSGERALPLAAAIAASIPDAGGAARKQIIQFRGLRVPATLYVFRAPRSYSGEDLVEFHLPGSVPLVKMLLAELLGGGARLAQPGEFTARAYFNGRMDLAAAEGVAATIAAANEQELSAARQLMAGELARRLAPVMNLIADTLALVEVAIDFSQEDVTFLSESDVRERIARADAALATLLNESARFERLSHEPRVVLVGRPNAGKSTLLNALAGSARAVVSPVAGTTRDALSAEVALARGIVHVVDVAGIDSADDGATVEAEAGGADALEAQMRCRAMRELAAADVVVLVEDATSGIAPLRLPRAPDVVIRSKTDLLNEDGPEKLARFDGLSISAVTGAGLAELESRLDALCFGDTAAAPSLALNTRHIQAASDARAVLQTLAGALDFPSAEILALELRETLDILGGILGRITPDDVLGRIFAGFCIGK